MRIVDVPGWGSSSSESLRPSFRVLELRRLFSQPNAFNVAPNRTLQRAGFRYLLSENIIPSPINDLQTVTRWARSSELTPPVAFWIPSAR